MASRYDIDESKLTSEEISLLREEEVSNTESFIVGSVTGAFIGVCLVFVLGTLGFSAAGITSGLSTLGAILGGGMLNGVKVFFIISVVCGILSIFRGMSKNLKLRMAKNRLIKEIRRRQNPLGGSVPNNGFDFDGNIGDKSRLWNTSHSTAPNTQIYGNSTYPQPRKQSQGFFGSFFNMVGGVLGGLFGLSISLGLLFVLGRDGFSASGISSGLRTAGSLLGGGMVEGLIVLAIPVLIFAYLGATRSSR